MTGLLLPELVLLVFAIHGMNDRDDRDLAHGIRRGDRTAFKAFFDRYHGLLYRYLRGRGVSGATCEDLLQNAFLIVWERRDRIDPDQSLRAFLFRIAHNRALNHLRNTAKFSDAAEVPDVESRFKPDRATDHALMQEALRRAVADLPERRRAVFELCFLHELTYREAAEVLGISIKTVENQMGHALKAVRKALADFL